MMNTHEGKVAIVTGGGSGLGESICKLLADRGATVVVTDISMESAERVAGEITDAGGKASAFRQDTARAEDSKKAVEYAMRSEEHTSELQSRGHLVCRLLLEKKNR